MADADLDKMHFDGLDNGTDADFQIMRQVLCMLSSLKGDAAYPVDRLEHSVQTATRAMGDGADEELIMCALLHEVGETLGPLNHDQVGATFLRPFVSEQNHWALGHHAIFQTYFSARHLGLDPHARHQYKDSPYYQARVDFTTNWDEVSFDANYPSEPLATFEPMVRSVFARPWAPPGRS